MPILRHPLLAPAFASLVLGLLATPAAAVYPTDLCVSSKLQAAGAECRDVLEAWATWDRIPRDRLLDRWLDRAEDRMTTVWEAADVRAAESGVDCSETTVTPAEMAALIETRAAEIAASVNQGLDLADPEGARCGSDLLRAAARGCAGLLRSTGRHLSWREFDRGRSLLESQSGRARDRFLTGWEAAERRGCTSQATSEETLASLESLADEAVFAATVSPAVPTEWTEMDPAEEIDYRGETLRPTCSRGTDYRFFAKRGTVNKLVVYFQGGGACWDFPTCKLIGTFKSTTGSGDNPANFQRGFNDQGNPDNPFKDWHHVFVPYCTGDIHWGDVSFEHVFADRSEVIEHRGVPNARVVEKFAREHFVAPEQVFVTGSSAGAYGAILHSLAYQEDVYPSADFAVLGDAGNGVITQDFTENEISKWNVEKNLPAWISELDRPVAELSVPDLYAAAANTYPRARFATYTAAYDGSTGGQIGFYQVMLNPGAPTRWLDWWEPTCEWNRLMREQNFATGSRVGNFRYYIGPGSAHTMWGRDRVYTSTRGGVPTLGSWVRAMLDGTPDWTNVECEDCGILLSGDPRPSPVAPPYTPDDRIECK